MGPRIERINVDRAGPLQSDFNLPCRDLNLIYGPNESGKTYLVEALINFLFKEREPPNRTWGFGGRVLVSGLHDDGGRIPFPNESEKKLEDYWEERVSITPDFSKLVVVRSGETILTTGEPDGVGRDLLKNCLSGKGLLDEIENGIQKTVRKAVIDNRVIRGDDRGKLRDRTKVETSFWKSKDLLERAEKGYTSGKIFSLSEKIKQLRHQFEDLQKAKGYRAAQLQGEIEKLEEGKRALPSESELAVLSSDVDKFRAHEREVETKSANLRDLASPEKGLSWIENHIQDYEKAKSLNHYVLLTAVILVVGSILVVSSGFGWVGVVGILGVLLIGYEIWRRNSELEVVKAGYRTRFGSDLTGLADLKAKRQELNDDRVRAQSEKDNLAEIKGGTRTEGQRISGTLTRWTNNEVKSEDWGDAIRSLIDQNNTLSREIESSKSALASLHVMEEGHLDEDPGVEWDPELFDEVRQMISDSERELDYEEARLQSLKLEVTIETRETTEEDAGWEELIRALREKYDKAVQDFQKITAEILAGRLVTEVIEKLRKDEDRSIAEGLNSEEVTKPLQLLTGHYQEIRLSSEAGLGLEVLAGDDDLYPLSNLSTGAREQIFLALRMGFASRAMGGETGFLILDDAFQHSDWGRRENLISQVVSLVQTGWQVFYFTMDDHIRDLFQKVGSEMGDGFAERSLT